MDIKLIVRNTGKEPLTVRHLVQDDDVRPRFTLTGKGAVILDRSDPESMKGLEGLILHEKLGILRSTRGTDLQPGDQASEKYASLACGDRLMSRCCYWTAAGNYQLTAELTVLVSPPPKGSKESGGYGIVRLTSVPVTISVSSEK